MLGDSAVDYSADDTETNMLVSSGDAMSQWRAANPYHVKLLVEHMGQALLRRWWVYLLIFRPGFARFCIMNKVYWHSVAELQVYSWGASGMALDGLVCSMSSSSNWKFLYQVGIFKPYSGPDYPGWHTQYAFACGSCWPFSTLFQFSFVLRDSLGSCEVWSMDSLGLWCAKYEIKLLFPKIEE